MDYFSAIEKAHEMGFDGIEFSGLPADITEQDAKIEFAVKLREHAEKIGIEISAYLTGANFNQPNAEALKGEIERLKGEVDIAKTLGVSLMRHDIFYALPKCRTFNSFVDEIAPAIREVTDYAEGFGIKTMFENHGRVVQDYDRVEKVIEAVGRPNFGLLIDIGNFMCADLDNVACVSRLANLAFHGHLKDFRAYADTHEKAMEVYADKKRWAKMAILNTAKCGKFSSDRTIEEYVEDIWHLEKQKVVLK